MQLLKNKMSVDVPTVERLPAPIVFVFPVDGIKNARWFSLKIKTPVIPIINERTYPYYSSKSC
jgi:hypothetical protein